MDGIDYLTTDMFGEGLYESCKEVKFGTMNTRAINFVGGGAQNFKGAPESVLYTLYPGFRSYTFHLYFCFFRVVCVYRSESTTWLPWFTICNQFQIKYPWVICNGANERIYLFVWRHITWMLLWRLPFLTRLLKSRTPSSATSRRFLLIPNRSS